MTIIMLKELNNLEKELIQELRSHPVLSQVEILEWKDFFEILLQRRFLSLQIANVYELVIDALSDYEAKYTVRKILHEEYPRNTKGIPLPSHRELLFQDLLNLGMSKEQILAANESVTTKTVRELSIYTFMEVCREKHRELALTVALRFWGEVLVSIEYQCLWRKMSGLLSSKKDSKKPRSEFYYFHMLHDARGSDLGNESLIGGLTHSQELGLHVKRLLSTEEELHYCMSLKRTLVQIKYHFYSQFQRLVPNP